MVQSVNKPQNGGLVRESPANMSETFWLGICFINCPNNWYQMASFYQIGTNIQTIYKWVT